jgi:hypothetical protein
MDWKDVGDQLAVAITVEQAAAARRLRVDRGGTWRFVAEEFYTLFPDAPYGDLAGNQGVGMYLCRAAARRLGEDPNADPWN